MRIFEDKYNTSSIITALNPLNVRYCFSEAAYVS